jgi:hypothetical protein
MSVIYPPQNPVPVFVFTPAGWIHGVFHVPTVKNLLSFLNTQDEILKLTDAVLPGTKQAQPFLALHKSATLLVVPQHGLEALKLDPSIAASRERRLVTCLLSLGSIHGHLDVADTVRTSDFLLRNASFFDLYQCHMGPNPFLDPKELTDEAFPVVLVNSKSLVGTTEIVASND